MPLNREIKKVLVIGSGPIVIGQAAEFDYSGTQACQALREEGIKTVLINSNPATIMTDQEVADEVYIEALTSETIERIIIKERPDGLLAGMGGQTALNLALELDQKGILEKYNIRIIGTSLESIKKGEDRALFKETMKNINEPLILSEIFNSAIDGMNYAKHIGFPVIVRPAYTLGGTGGGIAESEDALTEIISQGILMSPVGQVLIEKSVKGWKEIEYEVMRDGIGNKICVCNMENLDPVGIHTGDSIVVAPSQTLSDKEYQMLRTSALNIVEAVGIEGGCNVQYALNPESFEYAVIEINPRVSRSSALASKATGYPIAKVATKIALGYTLGEIVNDVTGVTKACFEPALDYVVVKFPKWPFDKFVDANRELGTKMMATGEVMAIGSNFEAAFLKALRSLELKQYHLKNPKFTSYTIKKLKHLVTKADDERIFVLAELIRRSYRIDKISELTGIDLWFLRKIKNIVTWEEQLEQLREDELDAELLKSLKVKGFSDKGIAELMKRSPEEIYQRRMALGIKPTFRMVDTCAGEFGAVSQYYYSSYECENEVIENQRRKIVVIGSGPIRIGQGIEFDYACVHCVKALKKLDIETILINSNPETVSTDFTTADRLYFEPVTEEDVFNILEMEKPEGVIIQFGGQTAIKLAKFLALKNIKVFGTHADQIETAENREAFEDFLETLQVKRPHGRAITDISEVKNIVAQLGLPVIVRPSFVLGGQGMEICYTEEDVLHYVKRSLSRNAKETVLIDKYMVGMEIEVDAICDGEDVLIPGIMEHIERAGIHSGDSMTVYPPCRMDEALKLEVLAITKRIATRLGVKGMINIQFIYDGHDLYVIEVNPRASRTVPYISKMSAVPIVELATKVSLGMKLSELGYGVGLFEEHKMFAVKVPVFSTGKLSEVEVSLGPEMKSTGEVLGVGKSYEEALLKGFIASQNAPFRTGLKLLIAISDSEKTQLTEMQFPRDIHYMATKGTAKTMRKMGIHVDVAENYDHIITLIREGHIDLILNLPTKASDQKRFGFKLRRAAAERNIPVLTSMDTFEAWKKALAYANTSGWVEVYALKDIHLA